MKLRQVTRKGKKEGFAVVGKFDVMLRQASFFVAAKDRRVHAHNKKLAFLA